ncbi:hypothetical protein ACHQM5_030602 [Ranunculus cassubicifolius]
MSGESLSTRWKLSKAEDQKQSEFALAATTKISLQDKARMNLKTETLCLNYDWLYVIFNICAFIRIKAVKRGQQEQSTMFPHPTPISFHRLYFK